MNKKIIKCILALVVFSISATGLWALPEGVPSSTVYTEQKPMKWAKVPTQVGDSHTAVDIEGWCEERNTWIMSAYWYGWQHFIKVDGNDWDFVGDGKTVNGIYSEIEPQIIKNNKFVKLTVKLRNDDSTAKTISLLGGTDVTVGVGDLESGDEAPVRNLIKNGIDSGFQMISDVKTNKNDNYVLLFWGRNGSDITDVDGYAYYEGDYGDGGYEYFNRQKNMTPKPVKASEYNEYRNYNKSGKCFFDYIISGVQPYKKFMSTNGSLGNLDNADTVASYWWKDRTIAAGETQTYSVLFGIGGADSLLIETVSITPPTATTLSYTGLEQDVIAEGNKGTVSEGGVFKYSLEENGTYSTDIPTVTGVGRHTVYWKVVADEGYNLPETSSGSFVVTITDNITITPPKDAVFDYTGSSLPLVTAANQGSVSTTTGIADAGKFLYSFEQNGPYSTDIPEKTEVGKYTVHWKVESADTELYLLPETFSGTFTVKIVEKITITPPKDATFDYTGSSLPLVTSANQGSLSPAGKGEFQYSLDEKGTYSSAIPTKAEIGKYTVYWKVESADSELYLLPTTGTSGTFAVTIMGILKITPPKTSSKLHSTGAEQPLVVDTPKGNIGSVSPADKGRFLYSLTKDGTYSPDVTAKDVGVYTIYWKVESTDELYGLPDTGTSGSFTVEIIDKDKHDWTWHEDGTGADMRMKRSCEVINCDATQTAKRHVH